MNRLFRNSILAAVALVLAVAPGPRAKSMTVRAPLKQVDPATLMANPDKSAQDAILASLEAGNARYRKHELLVDQKDADRAFAAGLPRTPKAMVLACADSRVVPERIFGAKPGELYVVRVAGNVATPETVASLEYGAEQLNIPVLIVLGHQSCTVVKACLDSLQHPDTEMRTSEAMKSLLADLEPACKEAQSDGLTGDALWNKSVEYNVKNTLRTILEQSPSLWILHHNGKLRTIGALYSFSNGQVYWLEK